MILVPRDGPSVLVTANEVPIPPQAIVQRLRGISPRLSLEWRTGAHVPYWGLMKAWGPEDTRWARVQSGELDPAYARDIDHMFPRDCSVQDIAAYVERYYGERVPDPAREAERIVEAAQRRDQSQSAENVDRLVEETTRRHLSETPHGRRVRAGVESAYPMVPGGFTP